MAPGCFACFFSAKGMPARKNDKDLNFDESFDMDAYMRNGLITSDHHESSKPSGQRQSLVTDTAQISPAPTARKASAAVNGSDTVFLKHGEQKRWEQELVETESFASQRTTPNQSLSRQTTQPASTRTSQTGSICKLPGLQAIEVKRVPGANAIESNLPLPHSPEAVRAAAERTASGKAQQKPALHNAWNTIIQPDIKPEPVRNSTSKRSSERTVERKPVEKKPFERKPLERKPLEKKPSEKKPAEKKPAAKKTLSKAMASQVSNTGDSKKGSYVQSWLQAQQGISCEAPGREAIAPVQEESRSQVSATVSAVATPKASAQAPQLKRQTYSSVSVESDEMFPGRREVLAEARDMAREMKIKLCINDPDLISRFERHVSEMSAHEQSEVLEGAVDKDELFRDFLASVN